MGYVINANSIEFPENAVRGEIVKFFESNIKVDYSITDVWDILKDIRNMPIWHPYMFYMTEDQNNQIITKFPHLENRIKSPTIDNVIYFNKYGVINGPKIINVEYAQDLNKTMKCHIYTPIDITEIYDGHNFFEMNISGNDIESIITFKRFCEVSTSKVKENVRKAWFDDICKIASDITQSLAHVNFVPAHKH